MSPDLTEFGRSASVKVDGSTVTVEMPASKQPKLGDYADLLRDRGLDPAEWVVIAVKANEWDAMTGSSTSNAVVRMKQWTITLKPSLARLFVVPAVHVPAVKRSRVGPPASEKPETILIEGDHHVPYQDRELHEASLVMLRELAKKHRLAEHVFLGDTLDLPTISRHDDHPAAMATPQQCIQDGYTLIREKCEAAPNVRRRKLKGNHDWRFESELLKRAERMYALSPAQRDDTEPELPALHLNRLLHLPELGVELVEDKRGWQHAEVEIVPGPRGLVVRHGWLHGASSAKASLQKRGKSIIVGHIHRREHVFYYDPFTEVEHEAVVLGIMGQARGDLYPHYTTCDNWLQGCGIVTRWPDDSWNIEHVKWDGGALRWRDKAWTAGSRLKVAA